MSDTVPDEGEHEGECSLVFQGVAVNAGRDCATARYLAIGAVIAMAIARSIGLAEAATHEETSVVALPAAHHDGTVALEKAFFARRSVREFHAAALGLAEVGQLLWAAQGDTRGGHRTAPSAGALYPLEAYVVASRVDGLAPGVYRYESAAHRLIRTAAGNRGGDLARAAYGQDWLREAAAILVLTAVERRTTAKYGQRGVRYVSMEAGHAAQNVLLQAVALGIGATPVGAFDDAQVDHMLGLDAGEHALYLIPVGRPR